MFINLESNKIISSKIFYKEEKSVKFDGTFFSAPKEKDILFQPQDIYLLVTEYFPQAKVKVYVIHEISQQIELEFHIPGFPQNFHFAFGFYEEEVRKFLQNAQIILKHKLFENFNPKINLIRLEELNLIKFNFEPKTDALFGNVNFFRFLIRKEFGSLIEPLFQYLISDSDENELILKRINISPDNIGSILNNQKDIELFKAVYKYKRPTDEKIHEERKQKISTKLKLKYPKLSDCLFNFELQKIHKELKNKSSEYSAIQDILSKQVIGQPGAIEKTAFFLNEQIKDTCNKTFLFVGPSGTGKTELAKTISEYIKKKGYILIPMNTFSSAEGSSRLFGSNPGYVGSQDKPFLAKEFDKLNPIQRIVNGSSELVVENAVILFDEFEKAHDKVQKSLLTLLDEFKCTMTYSDKSSGTNICITYQLNKCIIICTSNLFQKNILSLFQKGVPIDKIADSFIQKNKVFGGIAEETLGRMEIIPFGPIAQGLDGFQKLLSLKLNNFLKLKQAQYSNILGKISIKNENEILPFLEKQFYGEGTDIRKVQNLLKYKLWAPIENSILSLKDKSKDEITLCYDAKTNSIKWKLLEYVEAYGVLLKGDTILINFD